MLLRCILVVRTLLNFSFSFDFSFSFGYTLDREFMDLTLGGPVGNKHVQVTFHVISMLHTYTWSMSLSVLVFVIIEGLAVINDSESRFSSDTDMLDGPDC